jgi:Mor family transcriptional regulator
MTDDAIESIKQAVNQAALNFGLSDCVAGDLALQAANKIMKSIGGSAYYIPQKDLSERNEKIKAEWNGKNKTAICKKYAISKSTFYKILNKRSANA